MKNPNGPYPGRQVFIGVTAQGRPAFAYLVTGRSRQSRERLSTPKENSIIMGPLGDAPYDWLRHYTAVKYDNDIGLAAFSNGIQTEAIYETYKLLYHTGSAPNKSYLKKIMDGANCEPDSLNTPRVAGVITNPANKTEPVYHLGIVTRGRPAAVWQVKPEPGRLTAVSVYNGNMENPGAFNIDGGLPEIEFSAKTARELAEFIYEISWAADHGDDIRVCAIGGIREGNTWEVALLNRHRG
jgi:IMP cyclohydrolase